MLKTKDQVLGVFKQFQASVERETGKKLKCIRTDNGVASHVTSRNDFFSSYAPGDFGILSMGNETVSRVVGLVQFV